MLNDSFIRKVASNEYDGYIIYVIILGGYNITNSGTAVFCET